MSHLNHNSLQQLRLSRLGDSLHLHTWIAWNQRGEFVMKGTGVPVSVLQGRTSWILAVNIDQWRWSPLFQSDMRYMFGSFSDFEESTPWRYTRCVWHHVNFGVTHRIQGGSFQPQNNPWFITSQTRELRITEGLVWQEAKAKRIKNELVFAMILQFRSAFYRITTSPKDKFIETLDHHCWSVLYIYIYIRELGIQDQNPLAAVKHGSTTKNQDGIILRHTLESIGR